MKGALSLSTLTPCFSHSAFVIHSSWADSRQARIAAPFHATIIGSMGVVTISVSSENHLNYYISY